MADADGSVVIAVDLNVDEAEKEYARLRKKLISLDESMQKSSFRKSKLAEQSADIAANLDRAKETLYRMEQAPTGTFSKNQLEDQQNLVKTLQAEYDKLENEIDKCNKTIRDGAIEKEYLEQRGAAIAEQISQLEKETDISNTQIQNTEQQRQTVGDLNAELNQLLQRQRELNSYGLGLGLGKEKRAEIKSELAEVNQRIDEIRSKLSDVEAGAKSAADGFAEIATQTGRADSFLDKFTKRVVGLAKRVFIFSLITRAFRQLLTWMNKVTKTNGDAAAAIARLKGALLTLAQPLIEVIIPAFTTLVNVLARVVAVIAQFVSALFGKTLKQSADSAKALYEEANALGSVGSAAEDAAGSLAGFDEINTISTENASGGGGVAAGTIAPDFSWMDGVGGILDKLKEVADLVGLIAAGLGLWKLSSLLPGALGDVARILAGILLTVGGLLLYWNGLTDAWENGVDWANLIEMIGGLAAAALGLYLLLGPIAAGIALIVGGLGMLVTAFHDAMENGWNLQNTLLAIAGILATGLGIALLTGSWIPLLIAGIAAVLLAITVATGHGEEFLNGIRLALEGFMDFFKGVFTGDWDLAVQGLIKIFQGLNIAIDAVLDGVRDAVNLFLDWLDEKTNGQFHNAIETIRTMVSDLIDGIKQILDGFVEFLTGVFTGNIEQAINGINTMVEGFRDALSAIVDGLQNLLLGFLDWLDEKTNGKFHGIIEVAKEFVNGFCTTAKEKLNGLAEATKQILTGIVQFIAGVFTKDWELRWEDVKNIFKGIWNGIVTLLESAINYIVRGINSLISGLNSLKLPDWIPGIGGTGINIPKIPETKLPRLAQGAVIPPNREFMAVLGDQSAGNNLEAPESLIRKIVREESGGGNEQIVALLKSLLDAVRAGKTMVADGKTIAKVVTQEQNRMTRMSGKPVLLG